MLLPALAVVALVCCCGEEATAQTTPAPSDALAAEAAEPARLETSVWWGPTSVADREERHTGDPGLRFVEVAVWATPRARVWAQFDNGLSFDNIGLRRDGRVVAAYYGGGFVGYGRHVTRVEVGFRALPEDVGQRLLRGEQVLMVRPGYALKAGGWLGLRTDGRTESVGHLGVGLPAGGRLRVEPTFFWGSSGLKTEREWRMLLAADYRLARQWHLAGGVAGGGARVRQDPRPRTIGDAYGSIARALRGVHRLSLAARAESVGDTTVMSVALGLTVGLLPR